MLVSEEVTLDVPTLTVPEAKEVIDSTTERISKSIMFKGKIFSILSLLLEVQGSQKEFRLLTIT